MAGLNRMQQMVIECVDCNCVVNACPGSGKTKALVEKAIYLIERRQVAPSSIQIVTHTNTAIDCIRNRLAERLSGDIASAIGIQTIHSMAFHLVNLLLSESYVMIDTDIALAAVERAKTEVAMNGGLKKLYETICNAEDSNCDDENVLRLAEVYKGILESHHYLCFNTALQKCVGLLRSGRRATCLWKHLLIDEYQDVNKLQHELIMQLCWQRTMVLTVVGDSDQALYSLGDSAAISSNNGESVNYLHDLICNLPDVTVVNMYVNYRSNNAICATAQSIILHDMSTFDKPRMVARRKGIKVDLLSVPEMGQFDAIAQRVLELQSSPSICYRNIAVLVSSNCHLKDVRDVFRSYNIPLGDDNSRAMLFDLPEIRPIIKRLRSVCVGTDLDANRRYIEAESVGDMLNVAMDDLSINVEPSVFEQLHRIAAESDKLVTFLRNNCPYSDGDADHDSDADQDGDDGVYVGTVHSAKGREWRYVFVVREDSISHPAPFSQYNDDCRLLYVAVSRAIDRLCLVHAGARTRTDYLSGLSNDFINRIDSGEAAAADDDGEDDDWCDLTVDERDDPYDVEEEIGGGGRGNYLLNVINYGNGDGQSKTVRFVLNENLSVSVGRNRSNMISFADNQWLGRYGHVFVKLECGIVKAVSSRDCFLDGEPMRPGKCVRLVEGAELKVGIRESGFGLSIKCYIGGGEEASDDCVSTNARHSSTGSVDSGIRVSDRSQRRGKRMNDEVEEESSRKMPRMLGVGAAAGRGSVEDEAFGGRLVERHF